MSELAGKPLHYLIALEQTAPTQSDVIVEIGYDARDPTGAISAKYCNLRDEKDSGRYGPYLPPDDIENEYGEPAPDPTGSGFWNNLTAQLDRARSQGFKYVELDNLDTYDVETCLKCFDKVHERDLDVFVKNPLLVDDDPVELLQHQRAVLVIVENGGGDPQAHQRLREQAGKPDMPIRFVAYDDGEGGEGWADRCASEIEENSYYDMGVTLSAHGEYASSEDVCTPELPVMEDPPAKVEITTQGDVVVFVNGKQV